MRSRSICSYQTLSRTRQSLVSPTRLHSWHSPGMKPKTEELLYLLLWASEIAARPTFRNLTGSFEAWAYRNGFHRQLAALEQQQLLETKQEADGLRLHRLTEAGRL